MAILYDSESRIFRLHTRHTSYQICVDELGYLLHLYYGRRTEQDMRYRLTFLDRGFSGNPKEKRLDRNYSLDVLPQEYPFRGTGDYRSAAFCMENADGALSCDLRFCSYEICDGKYRLSRLPSAFEERTRETGSSEKAADTNGKPGDVQTLKITLRDAVSGTETDLYYAVFESADVITRTAVIRNGGGSAVTIKRALSLCLDFPDGNWDLLHFHGRHTMEMQPERTPVGYEMTAIGSRRGTSSHQHNPGVILAARTASETYGDVYGCLLAFSGGFVCEAERDQFSQTRLVMGMSDDQLSWELKPGEALELPECVLAFTHQGFRQLSLLLHDFIRDHVLRDPYLKKPHPVLINSWEAAYFDFDKDTILGIAKEAARLGMDMVVMDDGWFGGRKDDLRGLGDWYVNEEKLGCSLSRLIEEVAKLGLKFGIWIEPEMVNEDSLLYREHPDWVLKVPGKDPVFARNQLVLDFSREDVREGIFTMLCRVLDQGPVSYVKWDLNRSIADVYSLKNAAGRVRYEYVAGVYEFAARLLERYPGLLIEGCSGGGGRFDLGMLYYTPQIWGSDNSDALDRVFIQNGYSYLYPVCCVGAHVSAVPNHQTGRITPLKTRGITAMAGTFGYELDPGKLSEEEKEEILRQIRAYRQYESLIREGDYYRLSDPAADGIAAWAFVSKDKTKMLINYVQLENHGNMEVKYIRAAGLSEELIYISDTDGKRYEGAALMYGGLPVLPPGKDYAAGQILFTAEGAQDR